MSRRGGAAAGSALGEPAPKRSLKRKPDSDSVYDDNSRGTITMGDQSESNRTAVDGQPTNRAAIPGHQPNGGAPPSSSSFFDSGENGAFDENDHHRLQFDEERQRWTMLCEKYTWLRDLSDDQTLSDIISHWNIHVFRSFIDSVEDDLARTNVEYSMESCTHRLAQYKSWIVGPSVLDRPTRDVNKVRLPVFTEIDVSSQFDQVVGQDQSNITSTERCLVCFHPMQAKFSLQMRGNDEGESQFITCGNKTCSEFNKVARNG